MMYLFGHTHGGACALVQIAISKQPIAAGRPKDPGVDHVVRNNVALCCVEIMRSFGQLLHNNLQDDPHNVAICCFEIAIRTSAHAPPSVWPGFYPFYLLHYTLFFSFFTFYAVSPVIFEDHQAKFVVRPAKPRDLFFSSVV